MDGERRAAANGPESGHGDGRGHRDGLGHGEASDPSDGHGPGHGNGHARGYGDAVDGPGAEPRDQRFLAERFEAHRGHLRAVAYRMLGSVSEADDAVQEAWLRLSGNGTEGVGNLGGWLTTVVGRVCLDMLRSRRSRREEPLDVHVPDPIVTAPDGRPAGPEDAALLADSVGLALLVVLETLSPAERLAFVLHDLFAVPFEQIAPVVDRSPSAARQLASRARRRVRGAAPVPDPDPVRQRGGRRRVPHRGARRGPGGAGRRARP